MPKLAHTSSDRANKIVSMLRRGALREQLDATEWEDVRVASRIAFETRDFLRELVPMKLGARARHAAEWVESVETQISFLAGVRRIAHVVHGVHFSRRPLTGDFWTLRRKHQRLISRLGESGTREVQRWTTLVTLGAIEIALVGMLWDFEWADPKPVKTGTRK